MTFNEFLNQAWTDHATQAEQVSQRLDAGIQLIDDNKKIPPFAQLITHVFGEHLGKWTDGISLLKKLKNLSYFEKQTESDHSVTRSIASLELASGKKVTLDELSVSDQVRSLAVAASALAGHSSPERAAELFKLSLDKAQLGINKEDPANRALAITSNNLACSLEEKTTRSGAETELMILAARTARKYWEISGAWLEIERAEYRLAMSYLQAGDLRQALVHAQACLEISQDNSAPPIELFFGYESLAKVEKARGNELGFSKSLEQMKIHFEKLSADDQAWCKPSLSKLV